MEPGAVTDPWIIWPVGALVLVALLCGLSAIVNLATLRSIRPPKREPFPTIRRRELSFRDVLIPGLIALITGLLISVAASFLHDGLTRNGQGAAAAGMAIFFIVVIAFAVSAPLVLRKGMEIQDLATDPVTIAAAAKTLYRASRDDVAALQILNSNYRAWQKVQGAQAVTPGSRRESQVANAAMAQLMPGGRPPQKSRWRLLPALLRTRPVYLLFPIAVTLAATVIALYSVGNHVDRSALELAAMRATVWSFAVIALLMILLFWWSHLVASARLYRVGQVSAVAAEIALRAADARIRAARAREDEMNDLPRRIDQWGATAAATSVAATRATARSAAVGVATGIAAASIAGMGVAIAATRYRAVHARD